MPLRQNSIIRDVLNVTLLLKDNTNRCHEQPDHHFWAPKPDTHPMSSRNWKSNGIWKKQMTSRFSGSYWPTKQWWQTRHPSALASAIYKLLYQKASPMVEYYYEKQAEAWINVLALRDSLYACQTLLIHWLRVKLPVQTAALRSTVSLPVLLPPVKEQRDSSDTEQLPPESLLSWACERLPSAAPCTMSHLPFMPLRAFKSLQSSSGGMQGGNSNPPTSRLL